MRFRIILLLALLSPVMYVPYVFATNHSVAISSYSIELEVDASEMIVHETIDVFFTATAPELSLHITPEYENLEVVLDGSKIVCTIDSSTSGTAKLTCPLGKETRKRFLTVTYDTPYPVLSLNGDQIMVRHRYMPVTRADEFDVSVILPSGYVIEDTARYIVPEPNTIYSDGRRIIVGWERANLIESFGVSVVTSPLENNNAVLIYGFVGLSLLAIISFILWRNFFSRRMPNMAADIPFLSKEEPGNFREIIYPDLLESEEKVVEALKANLGVLKQKDLVKITGFSKAKMSRLLKQMESRNIVRSKPYGNSRKIYLVTEKDKQQIVQTEKSEHVVKTTDDTRAE